MHTDIIYTIRMEPIPKMGSRAVIAPPPKSGKPPLYCKIVLNFKTVLNAQAALPGPKLSLQLCFYGWDGGGSTGAIMRREYRGVQVVCANTSKTAARERRHMGLRTVFEST